MERPTAPFVAILTECEVYFIVSRPTRALCRGKVVSVLKRYAIF